jgi:hypothetical protein
MRLILHGFLNESLMAADIIDLVVRAGISLLTEGTPTVDPNPWMGTQIHKHFRPRMISCFDHKARDREKRDNRVSQHVTAN